MALRLIAIATGVAWLVACSADPPLEGAGAPVPDSLPTWTIDSNPALIVGNGTSLGSPPFGRVVGARRLQQGSIVVSDLQAAAVTHFDSAGRYIGTIGRTGSGPGEFRSPGPPKGFAGDSFFVVDLDQRRITIFDERARPVVSRVLLLKTGSGVLTPIGLASTDRFVGTMVLWNWPERPGHRVRTSVAVVAGRFDRPDFDTLSPGHGDELIGGIWREGAHEQVVGYPLEFGSSTQVAVGGARVYVGETARPSIQVYDLTGQPIREIRWLAPRDLISEADRRARIAQESVLVAQGPQDHPEQRTSLLEHLRSQEFATEAPAFTALLPADDGMLWVEQDPRPWTRTRQYVVFDSTGVPAAKVAVPRPLVPYQVDAARVLGRWREPDGPDQVRLYWLRH